MNLRTKVLWDCWTLSRSLVYHRNGGKIQYSLVTGFNHSAIFINSMAMKERNYIPYPETFLMNGCWQTTMMMSFSQTIHSFQVEYIGYFCWYTYYSLIQVFIRRALYKQLHLCTIETWICEQINSCKLLYLTNFFIVFACACISIHMLTNHKGV